MKTFVFAALTIVSAQGMAQEWKYAAQSDDMFIWGNVGRQENVSSSVVRMWFRGVVKPEFKSLKVAPDEPNSKRYVEAMQYVRINCEARTIATISLVYRDAKGNVVGSFPGNEFAQNPIVPDSIGDGMRELACSPR